MRLFQPSLGKLFVDTHGEREETKEVKSRIAAAGLALAAIALAAAGATAEAATLWASNVGTDSSTCGSSAKPCRSISQAMVNATDGDTILVGPGHYGDVNGDGNFTGPGDEQPDPAAGTVFSLNVPLGCIVCITKALHVYSTAGAALTFIEANASTGIGSTVMLERDGIDFGSVDHGFTITGGNAYGVTVAPNYAGALFGVTQNMTITGNIDIGDTVGFNVQGLGWNQRCPFPYCQFTARILVASNRAINNSTGFKVNPNYWQDKPAGQFVVRDNEALGAVIGFSISPGTSDDEFNYTATDVRVVNNIASHNGTGFYVDVTGLVSYNTALDNSWSGFAVTPWGAAFQNNAAIGNGGPGVILNLSDTGGPGLFYYPQEAFSTFSDNSFFGNDRKRPSTPSIYGLNLGPSAHCGVLNLGLVGASPLPATQLQAANNYWGSSDGPSSSGPGDNAGGACDQNSSTTLTKPFSRTPPRGTVTLPELEN